MIELVESFPSPTIRHIKCEELLRAGLSVSRCSACQVHSKTLHSQLNRLNKKDPELITAPNSHTNYRYLTGPEKDQRLKKMHNTYIHPKAHLARFSAKLQACIVEKRVVVNEHTHNGLEHIMSQSASQVYSTFPENSFQRIFWEQQQKAATLHTTQSMIWHPQMIKRYLYLRHLSHKAYETLRESGCIALLSQRTLQDYTHCANATSGLSDQSNLQLAQPSCVIQLNEWEKTVALVMDEIYVKGGLVHNKSIGELVGFTNLGETNNYLFRFEQSIEGGAEPPRTLAKTMLVIMVQGLSIRLNFPYAQFPCTKAAFRGTSFLILSGKLFTVLRGFPSK